jgi:hypothetical protein
MKTITTLFVLSINLIVLSQSKKETQDWLKEKIEVFAYSNDADNYGHEYSVSFTDINMILKTSYISDYDNPDPLVFIYTIPIKELSTIIFEEKGNTTWMIISLKENKKSIKKVVEWSNRTEYVNDVSLIFYKSVNDSDMKNRIIKAFKNLIKVYGGVVVEEKF